MSLRRWIVVAALCCCWFFPFASRWEPGRNGTQLGNATVHKFCLPEFAIEPQTLLAFRAQTLAGFRGPTWTKLAMGAISMVAVITVIFSVSSVLAQWSSYLFAPKKSWRQVIPQLSKTSVVEQIWSRCETSEKEALPLVALAFSSSQWCFYGMYAWFTTHRRGFLPLVCYHCLRACCSLVYVWTCHRSCKQTKSLYFALRLYSNLAVFFIVVQVVAMNFIDVKHMMSISGMLSSCCSFVTGLTPLEVVPKVKRSQSSAPIPIAVVLSFALSSMLWVMYGLMLRDIWIIVPNASTALVNFYVASFVVAYTNEPRLNDQSLCAELPVK
eukprot:TRINITY_DN76616_c0_g1_i1.p1 TRINITY_DN76616_c0_g1~~TRINITY_DN76616_c0_g1_i1.p1  ORF type:complete len:326 (+),score=11.63 TRINITY_DN76616_c0_g1_i1:61-1038(+)